MASRTGKIQTAWNSTGSTLYAIIRNAIAHAWNFGGATFEAFNVANWSQYAVAMTEQGALSQFYVADLPAGAEAYYTVTVYEQAGIGPAVGDTLVDVVRAAQLADDVPHGGVLGGSAATLALKTINVTSDGDTITIAPGDFSNGVAIFGGDNSTGIKISATLGMTVSSVNCIRLSPTGGNGIEIDVTDGIGVLISSSLDVGTATTGVLITGAGTGNAVQLGDGANGAAGLLIQAGPNDHAIHIIGGSTAGDGILIESLNNGVEITAAGAGIAIVSDGTGISVQSNTDAALFLGANLLPAVVITANAGNAVEVNSVQSVDFYGRHRILSSLTSGFDLLAFPFIMTDLAGNPKTGLTVTSTVSLDGAAAVPTTNAPTEIGNGQYSIDLAASDRAGTTMMLRFTAPNARDLDIALINTA